MEFRRGCAAYISAARTRVAPRIKVCNVEIRPWQDVIVLPGIFGVWKKSLWGRADALNKEGKK